MQPSHLSATLHAVVSSGRALRNSRALALSVSLALMPLGCGEASEPNDAETGGASGNAGALTMGGASGSAAMSGTSGTGSGAAGLSGTAGAGLGGTAGTSSGGSGTGMAGSAPNGGAGASAGTAATSGASGGGAGGRGGAGGTAGAGGRSGASGTGGASGSGCSAQPATLRAAADCSGRLIGTALAANRLTEAAYATAAREFNYVTAENEMKWDATEPTRNQFQYTAADQIVTFARQNGMQVKGHALVWHSQLPTWVSNLTSATEVRAAMVTHIQQVMTHFRGQVVAWDVVNEAWNDNGASLRNSVFRQRLGDAFIDEAFQAARAADPTAKLYYNDYGTEGTSTKANSVYTMVQSMKMRGIPIDGVGLQMHVSAANDTPTTAQFVQNMQRLAALGLDVLVSEIDVHICSSDTATQRTRYHDLVAACVAQPRCSAVTVWGVTDRYSWLDGRDCARARGLLWDDNYAKKPAYTGVLEALSGR